MRRGGSTLLSILCHMSRFPLDVPHLCHVFAYRNEEAKDYSSYSAYGRGHLDDYRADILAILALRRRLPYLLVCLHHSGLLSLRLDVRNGALPDRVRLVGLSICHQRVLLNAQAISDHK